MDRKVRVGQMEMQDGYMEDSVRGKVWGGYREGGVRGKVVVGGDQVIDERCVNYLRRRLFA